MIASHLSLEDAKRIAEGMRQQSRTIALANGCFDPLHHGHIEMLRFAKTQADFLFVAVNTDESIQRLKGRDRPRFPLFDRVSSLLELRCVDFVVSFEDETACDVIRELRPSVVVKGGDYDKDSTIERAVIEEIGASLCFKNYVVGVSSTALVEQRPKTSANTLRKVHLVADFALDTYISGYARELSREFPHPVCVNAQETSSLGGGANLAMNLKRQALLQTVVGVLGNSDVDRKIGELLLESGINEHSIIRIGAPYSTCFKKVVAIQPGRMCREILRLDEVPNYKNMASVWASVIEQVSVSDIADGDVIVISSYKQLESTTVGIPIRDFLLGFAVQKGARLIGACRSACKTLKGYEFIVINEQECLEAIYCGNWANELTPSMLEKFGEEMSPSNVVVTMGDRGVLVFDADKCVVSSIVTMPCPPGTDPTGAGDVFLAVFARAISQGESLMNAASIAVYFATSALFKTKRPALVDHLLPNE